MESKTTVYETSDWKGGLARFFRRLWASIALLSESRIALVGLIIFIIIIFVSLTAPWLATHDPLEGDFLNINASSSREHWLGTDNLGRDIWSRLVYGAQNAMLVSFTVVPLGLILGVILGGIPGYYGGRVDNIMMRFTDAALSFPGLVLFMAILAILGPGLWQVILALILGGTASLVRFTRGLVLAERERDYVKAAKLIGEHNLRILFMQVIPNVSSPLIVMATVRLGGTLLVFAGLTYLGLGPPPPEPSWGLMLNEARDLMETAPWVAVYPGLAIFITVLGVNLLGDGLRDVLDPRLTEK
ncbi:MAG: ABC transporter permease [Deltaproteobacteria bacterium]|nr:ABC transporter permease [Deltaproteobacteria bacterium]MBW2051127.1 ABC transporter permease [Deltaproteobacteria bacterium]MBW2140723.1 ABC transporter permease [Deltaproteobacteria bacterium]MBW2322858.1 ABC transporter permease [Deltaproteobacteria bacterium]